MKLNINGSDYKIKFNILSRIKLSQKFKTEDEMFEFIKNGDFDTLVIFIRNCIQDNIDDSFFLSAFPKVQETKEAFLKLATKLIKGVPSGKRGITTLRIFLTIYDPFIFNA